MKIRRLRRPRRKGESAKKIAGEDDSASVQGWRLRPTRPGTRLPDGTGLSNRLRCPAGGVVLKPLDTPLTGKVTLKCTLQYANGDGANNGYLAFGDRRMSPIGEVRAAPEDEDRGHHPGTARCERRRNDAVRYELR